MLFARLEMKKQWMGLLLAGALLLSSCTSSSKDKAVLTAAVPTAAAPVAGAQVASSTGASGDLAAGSVAGPVAIAQAGAPGAGGAAAANGSTAGGSAPVSGNGVLPGGDVATTQQVAGGSAAGGQAAYTPSAWAVAHPGDYLYVRGGYGSVSQGLALLNAATGAHEQDLPVAMPAADWSVLYRVDVDGQNVETKVSALDPTAGPDAAPLRMRTIEGLYTLPGPGLPGTSDGLSPNGQWLALAEASNGQDTSSYARFSGLAGRFVVLDTAFSGPVRGVILDGNYRFFAISNDGNSLYLLENAPQQASQLGRNRWQLRVFDVKKGQMVEGPLSDQTGKTVALGTRQPATPLSSGRWLYTLGVNDKGDQAVYGLDLDNRQVRSLDVGPVAVTGAATGSATGSQGGGGAGGSAGSSGGANGFPQAGGQRAGGQAFAAQFGRQLLASGDGKTLYLVDNSASGSVMEIDATMFKVQRNQAFVLPNAAPAPQLSPTAGATPGARSRSGASGFGGRGRLALREAMLSPDGATLWLPGSGGLAAINTSDLQLRGLYLPDVGVESIAFSPDGARLYALSAEQGKIIRLDAQTGTRQGEIGYVDQPYALLHVLTNR
jgi:hypothetical protein